MGRAGSWEYIRLSWSIGECSERVACLRCLYHPMVEIEVAESRLAVRIRHEVCPREAGGRIRTVTVFQV